ncbi:hypothetical protein ACOME3_006765 [Neoechinorhynchus agilis]
MIYPLGLRSLPTPTMYLITAKAPFLLTNLDLEELGAKGAVEAFKATCRELSRPTRYLSKRRCSNMFEIWELK